MTTPLADIPTAPIAGAGGLLKLQLIAPDGARAEIYLHGAQVTSWIPAGGSERLFMSHASQFSEDAPIRGGIPVVFPQFGAMGPLPPHGLARLMRWKFAGATLEGANAVAAFQLGDTEHSRRLWDYPFFAELTVAVGGSQLAVTLAITNIGSEAFSFTSGLHTYFSIDDIATTAVEGLTGLRYRDAAAGWTDHQETASRLVFQGEVNRIYFAAPDEVRLIEPGRATVIQSTGFPEVVVWNPAAKCATMPDLEPDDYRRFACVEAALIAAPRQLEPGERWQGAQRLSV